MDLVIAVDDPRADDVEALLERHLGFARAGTPPEDAHALDVEGLLDPAVTVFSARSDGALVGIGALKHLDGSHAELKSMHTRETARAQGVGGAMLDHLLPAAADQGYELVSLETGTADAFAPALALYTTAGFVPCEPFGDHHASPHSTHMTITLDRSARSPDDQQ